MRSVAVTKFWPLLAIVMLAPLASAQVSAPPDDGGLANARALFRQADFRGATAAFQKIVDAKPSAEAYAGLVRSLLKADDVKAAEESSQKALTVLPESAMIHAARGDVYFRRGLISTSRRRIQSSAQDRREVDEGVAGAGKG